MGSAGSTPEGRKLSPLHEKLAAQVVRKHVGLPNQAITVALYLSELPSQEELREMIRSGLLSFDVFTSVPRGGRWVETPVDLERHLLFSSVNSEAALLEYAEQSINTPLAEGVPGWEIHAVTNSAEGRSMLLCRVDHTLGDGVALLQVVSRIATDAAGAPLAAASFSRPPRPKKNCARLLCESLAACFKYATAPIARYDTPAEGFPPRRPLTGGRKKLVAVPDHSLELIKAIKNSAGAGFTVNDVVFAATAGALRAYVRSLSPAASLDAARFKALVPIAFPRDPSAPCENKWTFLSTALPMGEPTPEGRLAAARTAFTQMKNGPEAPISLFITEQNASLPACMFGPIAQQVFSRSSLVFSNVPGPASPFYICGKEVLGLQAFYANVIMQTLCVSYRDTMFMTFTVDEGVVKQPELLPALYLDELRALAVRYGIEPSDDDAVAAAARSKPPPAAESKEPLLAEGALPPCLACVGAMV